MNGYLKMQDLIIMNNLKKLITAKQCIWNLNLMNKFLKKFFQKNFNFKHNVKLDMDQWMDNATGVIQAQV